MHFISTQGQVPRTHCLRKRKKDGSKKIEAIVTWPIPSCKKQVKNFTGLCSHRSIDV